IWLDPMADSPHITAFVELGLTTHVEVAIGRASGIAAALALCLQATLHTNSHQRRLAAGKRKREGDKNAIIRVDRIKLWRIGKAHGNPKLVQLVDGAQRLGIVTSKAISAFNNNVREFARASIRKHLLIGFAAWVFTRQHVNGFPVNR